MAVDEETTGEAATLDEETSGEAVDACNETTVKAAAAGKPVMRTSRPTGGA